MKKILISYLICLLCLIANSYATLITVETERIEDNRFEFTYAVTNNVLNVPITYFNVYFDPAIYTNYQITTQRPLVGCWSEWINAAGWFSIMVRPPNVGIYPGETIGGFSIIFACQNMPAPQQFLTWTGGPVLPWKAGDSGWTTNIPEPATVLLFGLGLLLLLRKK